VVVDGDSLKIPQAMTATQDSQHRHQEQLPGRKPNPAPHPRIRDRPQITDQVEIRGGRNTFQHRKGAIPPASTIADSLSKSAWDRL